MKEKNINFDAVIDRRNTNSLKYDFALERGVPENVLPLWVADMDFKVSDNITAAIQERIEHGIYGYSDATNEYYEAVSYWMKKKHNWLIKEEWIVKTPGVVFALAMAIKAYTAPGDGVMIQQPVYYPFREVISDNDRVIVDNTLVLGNDGKYYINFIDFERKIVENKVKLFLLCNPHNPVGRVWKLAELKRLGEICCRHNVIIISDEIHADFIFKGRHQVFASICSAFMDRTVTCTSPSKTFNLAGLQISNIIISNEYLRKEFKKQISAAGYSQPNIIGLIACEAAYCHGEAWHEELMGYLRANLEYMRSYIARYIPKVKMTDPEGTYLVWLDFRKLGLTEEERENLIIHKAGVWLDSGAIFGKAGEGFERINIACPRSVLIEALNQLKNAIQEL